MECNLTPVRKSLIRKPYTSGTSPLPCAPKEHLHVIEYVRHVSPLICLQCGLLIFCASRIRVGNPLNEQENFSITVVAHNGIEVRLPEPDFYMARDTSRARHCGFPAKFYGRQQFLQSAAVVFPHILCVL